MGEERKKNEGVAGQIGKRKESADFENRFQSKIYNLIYGGRVETDLSPFPDLFLSKSQLSWSDQEGGDWKLYPWV